MFPTSHADTDRKTLDLADQTIGPSCGRILSDEVWNTHIRQFFNVLGKQDTGFLRLTLRQHRADNHRFTQITRAGWPLADISAARIITEWHGR